MEVPALTLKLVLSLSSFKKVFFIQFSKFYCWKSNNSLDHWEDDVYLQDLFLSNWFLSSTFSWGNTMNIPKIFWGFALNPTRALPWTHWGGAHSSPKPLLIIAITVPTFSEKSKKKRPANFSLFRPLLQPYDQQPSKKDLNTLSNNLSCALFWSRMGLSPFFKKSHTCGEGGELWRIYFWHLLMNLKNKLLKWPNEKQNNFYNI